MSQAQPTPEATAEAGVNLEAGLEGRNDNTGAVQPYPILFFFPQCSTELNR